MIILDVAPRCDDAREIVLIENLSRAWNLGHQETIMVRKNEVGSGLRGHRSAGFLPVIAATCCFAAILGTVYVLGQSGSKENGSSEKTNVAQHIPTEHQPVASVESSPSSNVVVQDRKPEEEPVKASVPKNESVEKSQTRVVSLSKRVEGHVASGEFSKALELAKSSDRDEERSQLLEMVAKAQTAIGEYEAAFASIRMMPSKEKKTRFSREISREQSQAAGGIQADPTALINLILNQTSGPWETVDQEGGPDPDWEPNGIFVNAKGQLERNVQRDKSNLLKSLGKRARKADLNSDMAKSSSLRLVSLTRLQKEIDKGFADGKPVLQTMKYLAGLQRIQYVFVFPEENEIVIGGPAEGWKLNDAGRAIGESTEEPVLQLDDFVTVFRALGPEGEGAFGCSIVPRKDSMKKLHEFSEASNNSKSAAGLRRFVAQLENVLGMQDVEVFGIPANSRVGTVMVDADYRLKLIGIDKMNNVASIPSYFDVLPLAMQKNPQSTNALRWWLTMQYGSLLHSEDRNVFQILDSSVRCRSENEMIDALGNRNHTGQSDPANRLFADAFTAKYDELAKEDKSFADLRNIFDLTLVAALIRSEKLDEKAGWINSSFAQNGQYHPATYDAAVEVPTVANHRTYRGRDIVIQVAGGVRADIGSILKKEGFFKMQPRLESVSKKARAPKLPQGRWWWDVKQEN